MKITHTFYEAKSFGGSETFFTILKKHSKHQHQSQYVDRNLQYNETFDNFNNGFSDLIGRLTSDDFDVVHNHFFLPAFFCTERGISNIFTSHCMLSQEFKWGVNDADTENERGKMGESYQLFDEAEREMYPRLRNVYVFSNFHKKEIEAIGGQATKIPILMDTEIFGTMGKQQAREKASIPDKFTLLFLGRPTYYKGLGTLLDSLKFLDWDVQLVLLSDGVFMKDRKLVYSPCVSTRPHLREVSQSILLPEQVIIKKATSREEVSRYHSAADILICPSLYESVGYVNLEAMASGLPIVASNTCGIPEFVIDNETGLLFEPGNPRDLADKVARLRQNSSLVKKIAVNQKIFITQFDVRKNITIMDKLYKEIK